MEPAPLKNGAGIQVFLELPSNWTPVFTGVTTFKNESGFA